MRVFRDYFDLNRRRIIRDLIAFYVLFLLAVIGASNFANKVVLWSPVVVLGITLLIILSFHLFAAYLIAWTAAREKNVSLRDYIDSPDYESAGKQKLKR